VWSGPGVIERYDAQAAMTWRTEVSEGLFGFAHVVEEPSSAVE
jgi:hypothetical protein